MASWCADHGRDAGDGPTIGKGLVFLVTKHAAGELAARVFTFVAIYPRSGCATSSPASDWARMMGGPQKWQAVTRLRRDAHDQTETCWLHGATFCLSA